MPKQGIHLSRTHTFTTLHFDKNFFPAIRIIEILGKIIFLLFYHDPDKHALFTFSFWAFLSLGRTKKLVK